MSILRSRKTTIAIAITFAVLLSVSALPANSQVVEEYWVDEIETYLIQVDADTTAEIVIYIVQSLVGHGIKDEGIEINDMVRLGVYIFNELPLHTLEGSQVGIGKSGKDNGVLVLVAVEERQWRIEVGYGLEGYITDIESHQKAEQYLTPRLATGEFGEGLYDTIVALSEKIPVSTEQLPIRGTYFYENTDLPAQGLPEWVIILLIIIAILIFGGATGSGLGGMLRRSGSKRTTGGRSGGGGSGGRL